MTFDNWREANLSTLDALKEKFYHNHISDDIEFMRDLRSLGFDSEEVDSLMSDLLTEVERDTFRNLAKQLKTNVEMVPEYVLKSHYVDKNIQQTVVEIIDEPHREDELIDVLTRSLNMYLLGEFNLDSDLLMNKVIKNCSNYEMISAAIKNYLNIVISRIVSAEVTKKLAEHFSNEYF